MRLRFSASCVVRCVVVVPRGSRYSPWMRRTFWVTAGISLGASIVGFGCHRPPPTVPDAGPPVIDAGPPPPKVLELSLRVTDLDGGTAEVPLHADERPFIATSQQIEIQANLPLRNFRLRFLDEADRVMASDETLDVTDAGIRDQVKFTQPLLGGHRYTLVLDGQGPGDILDPEGHPVPEQRLEIQTTGEREQPPKPPAKKPSRRHRPRPHRR